jgi:hypothetical protein
MHKTLARAGAVLLFMTIGLPTQAHANASCSGDPCADVECTSSYASAAAYGSEYSHAVATAGGAHAEKTQTGGGSSTAHANGGAPSEADAKAKKDWSLKESTAKCSVEKTATFTDIDIYATIEELLHEEHGIALANRIQPDDFSIGCVADERIHTTERFAGRLYVGKRTIVLFDSARHEGLTLVDLALKFDGASLDAAAPVNIAGMVPTDAVVTLDFVDNAQTAGCSITLSA